MNPDTIPTASMSEPSTLRGGHTSMVENSSARADRVAELEDQMQQALGDIGKIRTGNSKLMSPTDLE